MDVLGVELEVLSSLILEVVIELREFLLILFNA
jgi:hypothetical protein